MRRTLIIMLLSLFWFDHFYISSHSNVTSTDTLEMDSLYGFNTSMTVSYDGKHRTVMYESTYESLVDPNYIIFGLDGTFVRKFEFLGGTLLGSYKRNLTQDTIFVELKGAFTHNYEIIDIAQLNIKSDFIYALKGDSLIEIENRSMAHFENSNSQNDNNALPQSIMDYNEFLDMGIKFSNHTYLYKYPLSRPLWWK